MSVLSHGPRLATGNGRPPYDVAPSRRCDGRLGVRDGARCCAGAMWLVPEVSFCAHHMPVEYIEIARTRLSEWAEQSAWLWRTIVEESKR